jgi:hypothetical protein
MWIHNQHYPLQGGSVWRVMGFVTEVVMGVLWLGVGVLGIWERKWMEMSERAMVVDSQWLFGRKVLYEVERGKLLRAWVYRALPYRVGAQGVKLKDWLVLEFLEPRRRCEVVEKVGESGPSVVVLARAINGWLGVAETQELVREGAMVNGVVLGRNGDGEVVVPRVAPVGWVGKEIGERRYAWEMVDGVVKVRRLVKGVTFKRAVWTALRVTGLLGGMAFCMVLAFGWKDGAWDVKWIFGAGAFFVWLVCDVMDWLMTRDWVDAGPETVEIRKLRRLSYKTRKVRVEDVSEVCVTCEQVFASFGKNRVEFVVNLKLKDGEYVKVATEMESAEEAKSLQAAMESGWERVESRAE